MTDIVPAWAEDFFEDGPGPALTLPFAKPLTPAWAYGDGSGRGVRVAVIDSGIEDGHPLVGAVAQAVAVEDFDDDEVRFFIQLALRAHRYLAAEPVAPVSRLSL